MSITAMKQALEVMGLMGADLICEAAHHKKKDLHEIGEPCPIQQRWHKAFDALRNAIAEAEKQEPVACRTLCELCVKRGYDFCANAAKTTPIITTPPAAQRQPLTDEAIWRQYQALWPFHPAEEPRLAKDIVKFARAVEAAHGIKEKNT
jgi:hypothetical protein